MGKHMFVKNMNAFLQRLDIVFMVDSGPVECLVQFQGYLVIP